MSYYVYIYDIPGRGEKPEIKGFKTIKSARKFAMTTIERYRLPNAVLVKGNDLWATGYVIRKSYGFTYEDVDKYGGRTNEWVLNKDGSLGKKFAGKGLGKGSR